MHIRVMPSLGDAIYCRPFVRAFATSIETKWPDLFNDMRFSGAAGPVVAPRYDTKNLAFGGIVQAIGRFFPKPMPFVFDLPTFPKPGGRYAVIRAPTLRRDFYGPARNPNPEYIRRAADMLGMDTVGVGNVHDGEWFDGAPPDVTEARWRGELRIPDLMGLVSGAALVIAGPGWTVPAALAYGVPHVVVYGGAAKWNAPEKLTDPRIDSSRIAFVRPDNFCRACPDIRHGCDKTITGFDSKFTDALAALSVRL